MRSFYILLIFFLYGCTPSIYIVRHAEKDVSQAGATMMTSDPPLSTKGITQSEELATYMRNKKIQQVFYSTYQRSKSTASPLLQQQPKIKSSSYSPRMDSLPSFLETVNAAKGSVLIIAHSNTIGSIVNGLRGNSEWTKSIGEQEHTWIVRIKRKPGMPLNLRKYAVE